MSGIVTRIRDFVVDYCQRHAHPLNAALHVVGVPMVFIGIYWLFTKMQAQGGLFIIVGYFLQYLGHKAQGNEVGEVTLLKKIWRRISCKQETNP